MKLNNLNRFQILEQLQNLARQIIDSGLTGPISRDILEKMISCLDAGKIKNAFIHNQLPVLVQIMGGTNVGKSTVFNLLAGKNTTKVDARAGATKNILLFVHQDFEFTLKQIFSEFDYSLIALETAGQMIERQEKVTFFYETHQDSSFRQWILMDSPDFDSTNLENHRVARLLHYLSDISILVSSEEKYADEEVVIWLKEIQQSGKEILYVLNKFTGENSILEDIRENIHSGEILPIKFSRKEILGKEILLESLKNISEDGEKTRTLSQGFYLKTSLNLMEEFFCEVKKHQEESEKYFTEIHKIRENSHKDYNEYIKGYPFIEFVDHLKKLLDSYESWKWNPFYHTGKLLGGTWNFLKSRVFEVPSHSETLDLEGKIQKLRNEEKLFLEHLARKVNEQLLEIIDHSKSRELREKIYQLLESKRRTLSQEITCWQNDKAIPALETQMNAYREELRKWLDENPEKVELYRGGKVLIQAALAGLAMFSGGYTPIDLILGPGAAKLTDIAAQRFIEKMELGKKKREYKTLMINLMTDYFDENWFSPVKQTIPPCIDGNQRITIINYLKELKENNGISNLS